MMKVTEEIKNYINSQPEAKSKDLQFLHEMMLTILPNGKLWFEDGKNNVGKVVSNPNIGYGNYNIQYKDGTSRAFFQIGLSANTMGISVYIMGLNDKDFLTKNFGKELGKAKITGYCIKFKNLEDIQIDSLKRAIKAGVEISSKI